MDAKHSPKTSTFKYGTSALSDLHSAAGEFTVKLNELCKTEPEPEELPVKEIKFEFKEKVDGSFDAFKLHQMYGYELEWSVSCSKCSSLLYKNGPVHGATIVKDGMHVCICTLKKSPSKSPSKSPKSAASMMDIERDF